MPVIIEISPHSVREAVEHKISTQQGSNVDSLEVLRELRRSGNLTRREEQQLDHLEHGLEQSSRLLFHVLSAAMESNQPNLDHHCVTCGLSRHGGTTLEHLAEHLYADNPSAKGEVLRKLRAGGAEKDDAIAAISEKLLDSSADAAKLSETTRILTEDPKNSALRKFYDTAVEYIEQLKDFATGLFRDIARLREAGEVVPIVDAISSRPVSRESGTFLLKGEDDGADSVSTKKLKPEEEAARVIRHSVVEKRIAELRSKLEHLTEEIVRTHKLAVEGPAEIRYAASIERNQDQVEAGKVAAELKGAESDEQWFEP